MEISDHVVLHPTVHDPQGLTVETEEYARLLLEERAGYERYGNTTGVADVDAELARIGHTPPPSAAKKRETATAKTVKETR